MRWLAGHSGVQIRVAQSASSAGQVVDQVFPSLRGAFDLRFTPPGVDGLSGCDVAFLAVDNGQAACLAKEILGLGCKVIDLSADHRFRSASGYEQWYANPHPLPDQALEAVYGLPELHSAKIARARVIGNPGCYATASILALAPLLASGHIDPASIVIDGKSGVSGAGRSSIGLGTHFAEVNEAVSAYKVGGTHRHTGEIEQELSAVAGQKIRLSFTPHLIPMSRGILVSCYAALNSSVSATDIEQTFGEFYADQPFVKVFDQPPSTKHTLGSARCHLSAVVDERVGRVSVFCALDNLGKGMATQAIQNMNLMFGLDQATGLQGGALWP